MPDFIPVFSPVRCVVPPVEPIAAIPNIEDCAVPLVPDPINSCGDPDLTIPGPQGPAGEAGPCPQVYGEVGSVITLPSGSSAYVLLDVVSLDGCQTIFDFTFGLPMGPQGPRGRRGPQGGGGPQSQQSDCGCCPQSIGGEVIDVVVGGSFDEATCQLTLLTKTITLPQCMVGNQTDEVDSAIDYL